MINHDKKGILYNNIIDRNIEKLFKYGIDLKDYLNSKSSFYKIESIQEFKEYDYDNTQMIVPANFDSI